MAEYESRLATDRLTKNPRDAEARFPLGAGLLEAGKNDEAYKHLSAALAIRPDLDEALHPCALCALRLKRWDDADAWASACLKKCPFERYARDVRGQARTMQKRYAEAAEDFSILLKTYPRAADYFNQRAFCYEALGQHDLARADRAHADKVGQPGNGR